LWYKFNDLSCIIVLPIKFLILFGLSVLPKPRSDAGVLGKVILLWAIRKKEVNPSNSSIEESLNRSSFHPLGNADRSQDGRTNFLHSDFALFVHSWSTVKCQRPAIPIVESEAQHLS
jgi:hypothetical protein